MSKDSKDLLAKKEAAYAMLLDIKEYCMGDLPLMAGEIGISVHTVRQLLRTKKPGVSTRNKLTATHHRLGLADPPSLEAAQNGRLHLPTLLEVFNMLDKLDADTDVHTAKAELALRILQERGPSLLLGGALPER
jgi:hypothetical protein